MYDDANVCGAQDIRDVLVCIYIFIDGCIDVLKVLLRGDKGSCGINKSDSYELHTTRLVVHDGDEASR